MANKVSISEEIQKKRVIALNKCMERYELDNVDLHNAGCGWPSEITQFMKGERNLTDYVMERIYDNVFKEKGVRKDYLLGNDEDMTEKEHQQALFQMRNDVSKISMEANQATMVLLEYALKGVYLDEELRKLKAAGLSEKDALKKLAKVSPPENMIAPADALFLTLQLQEEAEKLVWSYLHRDKSPLWSFIHK